MCNFIGYKVFCLDYRLHYLKLQVCFKFQSCFKWEARAVVRVKNVLMLVLS
jgi:hypothetical protein